MKRAIALLVTAAALSGCADLNTGLENLNLAMSPVGQGFTPAPSARLTEPFQGEPSIRPASNPNPLEDVGRMYAEGYGLVGYASFGGKMQLNRYVISVQAKRAGAAVAIVSARYAGSVQGLAPVSLPNSSTTYVNGTASAYGSGGFASGSYNATATTTGTSTALVPFSVAQYDQAVMFFAPLIERGLGTLVQNPTADDSRRLGSAQAVRVFSVWRGSPAFTADILPGDFLLSIDGKPVYDATTFDAAQASAVGRAVQVRLWRDGKPLAKTITLR